MAEPVDGTQACVPAAARWFVRSFLAIFVVCAIFGFELWPLTGFRLFSHVRSDHRIMWVAETVGPNGSETPLWFTDLPRAYQGFDLIMGGFRDLPSATQRATCAAWLTEARHVRPTVTALHIYRVAWRALPRTRDGDRPARPGARTLAYAC